MAAASASAPMGDYWSIGDNGSGIASMTTWRRSRRRSVGPGWKERFGGQSVRRRSGSQTTLHCVRESENPSAELPAHDWKLFDVAGSGTSRSSLPRREHCGWNTYENNKPTGFITPVITYRTNVATRAASPRLGPPAPRHHNFTTAIRTDSDWTRITVSGVMDASFNGTFYVATTPTAQHSRRPGGTERSQRRGSAVTQNLGLLDGGAFMRDQFPVGL